MVIQSSGPLIEKEFFADDAHLNVATTNRAEQCLTVDHGQPLVSQREWRSWV